MTFWNVISVIYVLTTVFAIYRTYQEQKQQERPSFLFGVIGYLCCTIWPVVAACIFVITYRRSETALSGRRK